MGRGLRKRDLEILVSRVPPHPHPKVEYEQYASPPHLVSRLLWIAEFTYGDIAGRNVADLGAGTGRLGLAAAALGARLAVLVDVDAEALQVARAAAQELGLDDRVCTVCADVGRLAVGVSVDTVVQNPPFGVHRRGADVEFLRAALGVGGVVYSIHKAETKGYIQRFLASVGCRAEELFEEYIVIPPMFNFHREFRHKVKVVALRVTRIR